MSAIDFRAEPNVMAGLRTPAPAATADEMRTYFHRLWTERAQMHAAMLAAGGYAGVPMSDESRGRQQACLKFANEEAQAWFRQIGSK